MKMSIYPKSVTSLLLAAALTALLLSGCGSGAGSVRTGEAGTGADTVSVSETDGIPAEERTAPEDTVQTNSGQIAIPGLETLYLAAGRTRQSVNLYNPRENGCLFRISLILEDGETLWTSDLMKPGKSVSRLTLSRPLDAGTYPGAVLKYDCFTLQDQTPLNGAEIKVRLDVK